MKAYLSYETEKREIRIVPIDLSERDYLGYQVKISFIDQEDAYKFLQFFSIEHEEFNWKYVKQDLTIYKLIENELLHLKGCCPSNINFNKSMELNNIELSYDRYEKFELSEEDRLFIISKERDQKLTLLGI
jgi:hypothetical protein